MGRWTGLLLFFILAAAPSLPADTPPEPAALPVAVEIEAEAEGPHLRERLALGLLDLGLPREVVIPLIATLPIVELRGAIPVGINLFGMRDQWWLVYVLAVAGNMVPIPLILLLLGPLSRWLMRYRLGRALFEWLFARTRRKSASIEKYETLGLTLFVAVPLPVTGGWTGAMAAFLMGMRFRHAMWSILLGVMIAGVIVMTLSLLGWIGAVIAFLVLGGMAVTGLLQMFRREERPSSAVHDQPHT